ncbi:MAG: low molecular weight phosphotyrosine protein phosphatase, partial [Pseudomonadota bacterium]
MTIRILAVCLGNICRSPTAEAVLRAEAARARLDLKVDSAGTSDWHIGNPPYPPAITAAAARGYDLAPLRARQVAAAD